MKKSARPAKIVNVVGVLPAGWLAALNSAFPICGLGLDVGTTTNEKSNPCVLSICQKIGHEKAWPLVVRWKSKDPAVAEAIIRAVISGLQSIGLRARSLCIDATNERYFAVGLRSKLSGLIPVELIVSSENTEYDGQKMLWKAYLGNLLTNEIEDGYGALPNCPWIKTDMRLVTKEKGTFQAEIGEDGGHGDVFDSCKLSLHAVVSKGGPARAEAAPTGSLGAGRVPVRKGVLNPFASKFASMRPQRRAI